MIQSNSITICLVTFMVAVFLFYGNCMAGPQVHFMLLMILAKYPNLLANCTTWEDSLQVASLIVFQYPQLTVAFVSRSWTVVGDFIINSGWF